MTGKNFDTLNDAYEPGRKLDKILLHVGYDDAEEWKGIVSSDEDDTQLIIPFAVSYLRLDAKGENCRSGLIGV